MSSVIHPTHDLSLKPRNLNEMSVSEQGELLHKMTGRGKPKEPCSRENLFRDAEDLGFLLDSADGKSLVQDLMRDASLLAQATGLVSEADGGKMGTHPPPSCPQEFISGDPASVVTRQRPDSPMGAHAPFTPTTLPAMVRQYDSLVHPPSSPVKTPLNHFMHHVQEGHPYPCSVNHTTSQPHQQHQTLPPAKKGFLGNKRQPKTNFTKEQLDLMEMTFAHSHYPSSVLRNQLSYVSGLSLKAIQTWFQNRRVRFKRRLGKVAKPSRQTSPSDPDPWSSGSVAAHSSPEYTLVYLPSKAESYKQASQLPRDGYQQGSPPNHQGVEYGSSFYSQFADRPYPDQSHQTAPSRDWCLSQQPQGFPLSTGRWDAVSPWDFANARNQEPSNEDLLMRGGQQYWWSQVLVQPSLRNWEWNSSNLSELSMTSDGQHLVELPETASSGQSSEGGMLPKSQPSCDFNSCRPATTSFMVPNQFSPEDASPEQAGTGFNLMHPQYTPYPQNTQRFTAPNATLQDGYSAAFPRQDLESNFRNLGYPHSYPVSESAVQHGCSNNYPSQTVLSCHHSDSHQGHQANPLSFTQTSVQSYSASPTSLDYPEGPPCSASDTAFFNQPTDNSVAQGTRPINDVAPAIPSQLLLPTSPPFAPSVALFCDPQPSQFSTQPQATPGDSFHARDIPLTSSEDEPLASPSWASPPPSACSFSSCNTLYIDLDAEID